MKKGFRMAKIFIVNNGSTNFLIEIHNIIKPVSPYFNNIFRLSSHINRLQKAKRETGTGNTEIHDKVTSGSRLEMSFAIEGKPQSDH